MSAPPTTARPTLPSELDNLLMVPRLLRMTSILDAWDAGAISAETLHDLLSEWWPDVEFPVQYGYRRLVRAFKAAGFVSDTPGVLPPSEPMTVYRGSLPFSGAGMSWTTDLEQARWFAKRIAWLSGWDVGVVWSCTVPPRHVLGIFHGRNEAEVVVNPAGIRRKITKFETMVGELRV